MKKVLLTGSSGFIGKSLKQKLINLGFEIVDFNSTDGDITNIKDIEKLRLD